MASAGHKLGQLIGDWYEEYFVHDLLKGVAESLGLYLDTRFVERKAVRGEKIIWEDLDCNNVDYDCVLELGGTDEHKGEPVAFIESFWRRGSRHSKDKARDDSGKLMPMRDTYPTARFLGIISCGDFTQPACDLVRSRNIDLFYINKNNIIKAFSDNDLIIDYPDKSKEDDKQKVAATFERNFTPAKKKAVAKSLKEIVGDVTMKAYIDRVSSALSALPQEYRITCRHESNPQVFFSTEELAKFLKKPSFNMSSPKNSYIYEIFYSDGTEFAREVENSEELIELHHKIHKLVSHMEELAKKSIV